MTSVVSNGVDGTEAEIFDTENRSG